MGGILFSLLFSFSFTTSTKLFRALLEFRSRLSRSTGIFEMEVHHLIWTVPPTLNRERVSRRFLDHPTVLRNIVSVPGRLLIGFDVLKKIVLVAIQELDC